MTNQSIDEYAKSNTFNDPSISLDEIGIIKTGWDRIAEFIIASSVTNGRERADILGLDGYIGTDWDTVVGRLKAALASRRIPAQFVNVQSCAKSDAELDALFQPCLGEDPVFGRLFKKSIDSLFDARKIKALRRQLCGLRNSEAQIVFCYGTGAGVRFLRSCYDRLFYFDLCREESLKRNVKWSRLAGKTQSISPKKLYYVDFPMNDAHRNRLLRIIDFYIDGNRKDRPILLSASDLRKIAEKQAHAPFRFKYLYEPGPWGGQWLKKIRQLPAEWINCAWSYEVIAPEMSLLIKLQEIVLELPWNTFFELEYENIMGKVPKRRFSGQFPIRYDYLDTMEGGDLSIQVHPTTAYIRKHFGEPYHQGEMYYIADAKQNTRVNLGLNEGIRREEFLRAARLADERGIPFDYRLYVNSVPSKIHDLLLIPPGTVHGSGEGQVVLEISATTYRYTFKIYDHLRPDLNGVMRPIHVDHAFNVIKWFRRSRWVSKHLLPGPKLMRSGPGWAEYLLADRREFFHIVCRLEFERGMDDDTAGQFHILTLVEGESVLLFSQKNPTLRTSFAYSETIVVPACTGGYRLVNQGKRPCKIAKARLR